MSSFLPLHLRGGPGLPQEGTTPANGSAHDRAARSAGELPVIRRAAESASLPAPDVADLKPSGRPSPGLPRLPSTSTPPTTDELGRDVGTSLPPESRHTFVLDWFIDTIRLEDGTLVYRVVGADFVNTDVCFFCRSEQEARTLLALVDGVCTTHTVIKTQLRR